jgi:CopG family nickel-responsive transcriptional regulator
MLRKGSYALSCAWLKERAVLCYLNEDDHQLKEAIMQRITLTLEDEFAESLELFMRQQQYRSRSEAMRDLMRAGMQQSLLGQEVSGSAVGTLSYVYNYDVRRLARRLAELRHAQHALSVSTTNMQLDHHSCLEVSLLRGDVAEMRRFADLILSERGVRHGALHLVPVEAHPSSGHDDHGHVFGHYHLTVKDGL